MGWVPRSYLAMDDRRVARLYSLDSQDGSEDTIKTDGDIIVIVFFIHCDHVQEGLVRSS